MSCLFLFVVSNPVSLRRFLIFILRPTVTINYVVVPASHLHSEAKELMLILFALKISVLVFEKYWTPVVISGLFSTSKFVASTIVLTLDFLARMKKVGWLWGKAAGFQKSLGSYHSHWVINRCIYPQCIYLGIVSINKSKYTENPKHTRHSIRNLSIVILDEIHDHEPEG